MSHATPRLHAAAAVCTLLCAGPSLTAQDEPLAEARQITRSFHFDMTPSPDDRHLLMVMIVAGHAHLFTAPADGSSWTPITHDAVDHEDPAWSPDSRRIAYVRNQGQHRVVHIMDRDGSNDRAITPDHVRAIHPSWSPDGGSVLFSTDDDLHPPAKNASEIYRLHLADLRIDTLVRGGVNTFPVLSPDGRRLAFRRIIGDMNSEVFVSHADGSEPRNLTDHPAYEGWPSWSSDGQRIAFAGDRNGKDHRIYVMNADGRDVRLLAATLGRATSPKWAPDGRSIYFTNCLPPEAGGGCDIMFAPLDP